MSETELNHNKRRMNMITAEIIKTATYDHTLTINGIACKGATVTVNGEDVLISVDVRTGELVAAEVIEPSPVECDWTLFNEFL